MFILQLGAIAIVVLVLVIVVAGFCGRKRFAKDAADNSAQAKDVEAGKENALLKEEAAEVAEKTPASE